MKGIPGERLRQEFDARIERVSGIEDEKSRVTSHQ